VIDLPEAISTIGLITCGVQQLVHEDDSPDAKDIVISNEVATKVRKTLDMMPSRPILDFLVRYFVTEVNWFGLLSHIIL